MEEQALIKLHPDHRKVIAIGSALASLPVLAGAIIADSAGFLPWGVFTVPALLAAGWFVLGMPVRRYLAKGYAMSEDRLRVVSGVLMRKDSIVPFGRVQHLDVEQGVLERSFGLATLVLHTAGTHNSSVRLPGLEHDRAIAMREEIRAHIKRETM